MKDNSSPKLSVVLAARNEEENLGRSLESVKEIADEIVVVDEHSTDKTVEIAKEYGAKVFLESHHDIFHITKQKALEKATGDWVLQLDADEEVTPALAQEIKKVIDMSNEDIKKRFDLDIHEMYHFRKHQRIIEERDGKIGKNTGEVVAFFIPRLNMFLGRPLRYGGVYPDGVIRLVKNGKARFPQKSVHEQIQIDGEISWLFDDLIHYDSPTMKRYLARFNRYTDLKAKELNEDKAPKNFWSLFLYTIYKPLYTFLNIYIRHKGILDGTQGFLWAFFSAMHFPIAFYKYITNGNE
ncbi:MAG: Glycosyl transferase, family 2 [Candidatus Woesebacteria bacterium GW2011_GWB1_39_10]|uniref:Glycosyl transferase, family 2 n=2 Tax=Candidatus Woeseibacteriota TaxID=1752722 RepID=A0A0G0LIW9_9BACT|nr:MAG: Glycosyl transferase, family 2 [Candidatus Woesebacteria bacterium GW2011_GWB1_39_10]KKS90833.1 MAG: Glycosyl transferase, family 2 [Candidatus Woesebacteria bacterium GW2011_GWA1_43_12]